MTASNNDTTVYILGSGASLLRLTPEERAFLAGRTTIAMNKYLLFWDLLGVWPKYSYLADIHHASMRVYEESVTAARRGPAPVHFLLADDYRRRYATGVAARLRNLPFRLRHWRRTGFWYTPGILPETATYFHRWQRWDAPEVWAETLDDDMYFYRGSLTCLLNLIAVLELGNRIKLLGVDLSSPDLFFQKALAKRPELSDPHIQRTAGVPGAKHGTAETFLGMPGIHTKWPFLRENLARKGIEVYCCNQESLLVTEGLCAYAPVVER